MANEYNLMKEVKKSKINFLFLNIICVSHISVDHHKGQSNNGYHPTGKENCSVQVLHFDLELAPEMILIKISITFIVLLNFGAIYSVFNEINHW